MPLNIYPTIGKEEDLEVKKDTIYPTITAPVVKPTITTPTPTPTPKPKTTPSGIDNYVPAGLDRDVVLLAKAIRQHESGNKAQIPGEGAQVGGASLYQYTHGTWKGVAQKYLGDANAPLTRENENLATYRRILDWKKQGFTPGQIASMWNAGEGEPNAYTGKFSNGKASIGTNKWGIKYNVPKYAERIYNTYKTLKGEPIKELPKTGEYQNQANILEDIKKNIKDPEVKKLVDSGKVLVDENGSVDLSDEYRTELATEYQKVAQAKNQFITKISGMPTATKEDINLISKYIDTGDKMRLNAAVQRIEESSKAQGQYDVNLVNWAKGFTTALDKLFEAPVLKQFKQGVGIAVGTLGAYENAIIQTSLSAVANAISKVKKEQPKYDLKNTFVKGAQEGFEFGKAIGEGGAKASVYAAGGVIPNALLSVPEVISGGSKLGEGIETGDEQLKTEGAIETALGIVGALPFYSGKMKSNLLIDRDFVGTFKKEAVAATDLLKEAATGKPKAEIINNIYDKKITDEINSKFDSAIKPSITGRKTPEMAATYNKDKTNAVMSIFDNKDDLRFLRNDEEVKGVLPSNTEEMSQAIDQTLTRIFKEYDSMKTATGDKGVMVNLKPVADKLMSFVDDPRFKAWEDFNPGAVDHLVNTAARLEKRGQYTPAETQALIEELNANLKAFYRNPSSAEVTKSAINASFAGELRKALDETITKTAGAGYQPLRNKYKQLKTIQADVNRARNRMANAPQNGLIDNITSPFAGAEILSGIVSGNPSQIARGVGLNAIRSWYKKISNPDFRINKMFENVGKLLDEREARLGGKTFVEQGVKAIKSVPKKAPGFIDVNAEVLPKTMPVKDLGKQPAKLTKEQIAKNIATKKENSKKYLVEEAKKYKTASEFVNSQIKKDYRSPHQINATNSITVDKINIDDLKKAMKEKKGWLNNYDLADLKKLEKLIGNPEKEVTIYRTSPVNELNEGDWVTLDKVYANDIKRQNGGKVNQFTVQVKDLRFPKDIDSLPSASMASAFQYNPRLQELTEIWNNAKQIKKSEVVKNIAEKKATKTQITEQVKDSLNPKNFKTAEDYVKGNGLIDESVDKISLKMSDGNTISFDKTSRVVNHSKGRVIQEIEGKTKEGNFIGARFLVNEDNKTLTIIGFSSEAKGNGYGTQLLNNIKEEARKNGITKIVADDTRTTNSLKYWEKQGFKPDGEINAVLKINPSTKSQLISEWNKANKIKKEEIVKNIQAKQIIDKSKPTTKILNELNGKPQVKRQFVEDLLKKPDIKQVEKDIITEALKTEGDVIDSKLFAKKVQNELLPLKVNVVGGESDGITSLPKYKNVALTDGLRGNVSKYTEKVYESPVKTSAGNVHFRNKTENYFGHTRIEDMADSSLDKAMRKSGKTRRVIEVQSDLYQKMSPQDRAELDLRRAGEEITSDKIKEKTGKLYQYSDPTAHYRMVREEVKQAAIDGKEKLQFPTGETAMRIEGLGDFGNWEFYNSGINRIEKLNKENISIGKEIMEPATNDKWIITDVLEDGKFKAIPKNRYNLKYNPEEFYGTKEEHAAMIKAYEEEFDISGKVDTSNPIYKFYQDTLGKYLKNRYNATEITDANGVKWYEVDIKPEMKDEPVLAFGHTTIKNLLGTGAVIGVGALIAGLASEKKQSGITNQIEQKSTIAPKIEPNKLSMPVFSENKIPKMDGIPLNEVKLPTKTPSAIKSIKITDGEQTWNITEPEKIKIANRIKFITDQIAPEYTNYLLKLANFEGIYNQKQRNDKNTNGTIDRGIFQINNKAFPQITDQMADNLDFSILWALSLIDAGKQSKWSANDKTKQAKIIIE